jgi:hypothetical protein
VAQHGADDWTNVATLLGDGHLPSSCRNRYSIYLDSTVKVGGWTGKEDKMILSARIRLGNRWSLIAKFLEDRSVLDVEARWCAVLKVRVDSTRERARCSVVKCTCWLTWRPHFCFDAHHRNVHLSTNLCSRRTTLHSSMLNMILRHLLENMSRGPSSKTSSCCSSWRQRRHSQSVAIRRRSIGRGSQRVFLERMLNSAEIALPRRYVHEYKPYKPFLANGVCLHRQWALGAVCGDSMIHDPRHQTPGTRLR